MVKACVSYRTDNMVEDLSPAGAKFSKEELERAVGGSFYLIPCNDDDMFFVVNRAKNKHSDSVDYNINANYLYRRLVDEDNVLKGTVLLCKRDLLEVGHIIAFSGAIEQPDPAKKQSSEG